MPCPLLAAAVPVVHGHFTVSGELRVSVEADYSSTYSQNEQHFRVTVRFASERKLRT